MKGITYLLLHNIGGLLGSFLVGGIFLKVLDAESLHTGIDSTKKDIERLKEQLSTIEKSVYNFSSLDDALRGKGGNAIRNYFKDCHLPFLEYFQDSLTEFSDMLTQMDDAINSFESTSNGYVKEEYLENDVTDGLDHVEKQTIQLTDEANSIIESVQDLVAIKKVDESEVVENVQRGKSKSAEIVEKLHALDESQVRALEPVRDRVKTMKNYLSELDSKFKSANLSVSSYNVNAIKDMKTYDRVITPFFNTDTRTGYEDDMSNQLQSRIKSINSSEIIMEAEQKKLDDSFLISANNVAEKVAKGIVTGGTDLVVDTLTGAYQMFRHPIQTAESLGYMVIHPVETSKYVANAIAESYIRDVHNGDAESRAHWVTYALGSVAGTKGAGTAAKGSKVGTNATKAAKEGAKNIANKATNVQMPGLFPFGPQYQLANVGPVPYNVVDSVNLRDQLMMSAKRFSEGGSSSFNVASFEKKIAKMNVHEKIAVIRTKAMEVAKQNNWRKDSRLTKRNGRDVYFDVQSGNYYALDTQHGRFEVVNKHGRHLGEVDFNLSPTK